MGRGLRHWLLVGLGWGFVVLGIIGLFLPVLQGILFLGIGLVLLAGSSPLARRLLDRLRDRYPKFAAALHAATARAARLGR